MKKLCVLLALVMIIGIMLSACGNARIENVKAALVGGTFTGGSDLFTCTYSFKADGTYYGTLTRQFAGLSSSEKESGTYEVNENAIILTNENGDVTELPYMYNSDNGKLILYYANNELTK